MSLLLKEQTTQNNRCRVDRERGLITNCKLLGWKSANGRSYDPAGVDPRLYEGVPVHTNHSAKQGQERSITDRVGQVRNARKTTTGVYGDIQVLKSHPFAECLFECAEKGMSLWGLSHAARGQTRSGRDGEVVTRLEQVSSVDIVGDPATNKRSLWEGISRRTSASPKRRRGRAVLERLMLRRDRLGRILSEMAEAGVGTLGRGGNAESGISQPGKKPPHKMTDEEKLDALKKAVAGIASDGELDLEDILAGIEQLLYDYGDAQDDDGDGEIDQGDDDSPDLITKKESRMRRNPRALAEWVRGGSGRGVGVSLREGDHKQALKDACAAIIEDDSLSEREMIKKLKAVLKMIHADSEPDVDDDTDTDMPAGDDIDPTKMESLRRGRRLAAWVSSPSRGPVATLPRRDGVSLATLRETTSKRKRASAPPTSDARRMAKWLFGT